MSVSVGSVEGVALSVGTALSVGAGVSVGVSVGVVAGGSVGTNVGVGHGLGARQVGFPECRFSEYGELLPRYHSRLLGRERSKT